MLKAVTFVLSVAMNDADADGASRGGSGGIKQHLPRPLLMRGGITCRNESFLIFIIREWPGSVYTCFSMVFFLLFFRTAFFYLQQQVPEWQLT